MIRGYTLFSSGGWDATKTRNPKRPQNSLVQIEGWITHQCERRPSLPRDPRRMRPWVMWREQTRTRQRHLAGMQRGAASDQARYQHGVVRRAKGPVLDEAAALVQKSGHAPDRGDLDGLIGRERRENPAGGEPASSCRRSAGRAVGCGQLRTAGLVRGGATVEDASHTRPSARAVGDVAVADQALRPRPPETVAEKP